MQIRQSTLKKFLRCPAAVHLEVPDTPAMQRGRYFHALLSGVGLDEFSLEKIDRRTNAGKARAEEIERLGLVVMPPDDAEHLEKCADATREACSMVFDLSSGDFEKEVSMPYHHHELAGRLDWHNKTTVIDFKLCSDASFDFARRQLTYGDWWVQVGVYALLTECIEFAFVCCEADKASKDFVGIYVVREATLENCIQRTKPIIDKFIECADSGSWPGYGVQVL